jgi:arsenate reductase-like glutaredoxin family protein
LLQKKAEFEERDMAKNPLSESELDALIGERPHTEFLSTRNELYRSMGMKLKPPTRAQAIKLMAKEPNLIKRPIFRKGAKQVLGFDEKQVAELL